MKNFLLRLILVFLVLAQAQQSTVNPGGEASGSTGTTSYSVGQLIFIQITVPDNINRASHLFAEIKGGSGNYFAHWPPELYFEKRS